ncbi:uncharacterized protein At1g76660 isoform X1 [Solanum pennellii]|uniref:Uncharacterized protein At1g76660 isoform X1 n=1 Tax=Solanum pennellii TaxID=28526 RepID=A0ABM1FTN4_SOLPN|nr:uncharacterized protein At1g76660 isoform X1 [Solanum pennellii]
MGSEQNRFPQQQGPPLPSRHKRWGGCLGGLSCFGRQKGGKRIVPSSRIPEANSMPNQQNVPQAGGLNNQTAALLAPPSSPASFSNSALPSTAQSPSCFLSSNSPGGPSSAMFATGPYAHETQLVSPPVFSNFTTEPSTAPFTPPPELAHLTTPSSPDVPFARFLSSSVKVKTNTGANDFQTTYSLYPGSPASTLRSPVSRGPGERELPQLDPSIPSSEIKYPGPDSSTSKLTQDSNFFCPATFAQYYIDHSLFPHSGGRLSVSKETDAYSTNNGNGQQSWQNKPSKQDAEEVEAYRASFGFSADEIVSTTQYVEISDVALDESFSMTPFTKPREEEIILTMSTAEGTKGGNISNMASPLLCKPGANNCMKDHTSPKQIEPANYAMSDDEGIFSKLGTLRLSRKHDYGLASSDAEIDYRRGRSLREAKGNIAW